MLSGLLVLPYVKMVSFSFEFSYFVYLVIHFRLLVFRLSQSPHSLLEVTINKSNSSYGRKDDGYTYNEDEGVDEPLYDYQNYLLVWTSTLSVRKRSVPRLVFH